MSTELLLNITLLIATSALILVVILLVILVSSNRKYKKFTSLSKEVDIEKVLISNQKMIEALQEENLNHEKHLKEIDSKLLLTYSKMAITKYNAFDGLGGQMSAIVVLINKHNNGMLLHSIHTGEGNHLYTKIISDGQSIQPLSKEEKDTVKKAISEL